VRAEHVVIDATFRPASNNHCMYVTSSTAWRC
jgi:hypothetical protein